MSQNQKAVFVGAGLLALALIFIYRRRIAAGIVNAVPRKTDPAAGQAAAQAAAAAAQQQGQVFNPNRPLTEGVRGLEVEFLQSALNQEGGYGLKVDGIFGPYTAAALYDARQVRTITLNQYITTTPVDPDLAWTPVQNQYPDRVIPDFFKPF